MKSGTLRFIVVAFATVAMSSTLQGQGTGAITGTVTEDSTHKPVAGADVVILSLKRQTVTDANGRYLLGDVPAGTMLIVARRLGFEQQGLVVRVNAGEQTERNVSLARVVASLDTMKVTAPSLAFKRAYMYFDDHKKRGVGIFLDSIELKRREGVSMAELMRNMSSITVMSPPLCLPMGSKKYNCSPTPTKKVAVNGAVCAMAIVLDHMKLSEGGQVDFVDNGRADPRHDWPSTFDLTTMPVERLMAVEVYKRAGDVPIEYQGPGTECGVVQMWSKK